MARLPSCQHIQASPLKLRNRSNQFLHYSIFSLEEQIILVRIGFTAAEAMFENIYSCFTSLSESVIQFS